MTSGGTTSDDVDPETTTGEPEPEPIECWRLPLRVVPPAFVDPQGVLTSVPVLVDLSVFDQPVEPEDVRFYLEDGLLAHELDFDGDDLSPILLAGPDDADFARYMLGSLPYRLVPEAIELWQGGPRRLHDRFLYERASGGWRVTRLSP